MCYKIGKYFYPALNLAIYIYLKKIFVATKRNCVEIWITLLQLNAPVGYSFQILKNIFLITSVHFIERRLSLTGLHHSLFFFLDRFHVLFHAFL